MPEPAIPTLRGHLQKSIGRSLVLAVAHEDAASGGDFGNTLCLASAITSPSELQIDNLETMSA